MEHEKRISSRFSLQLPITVVLPETGLRVEGKTRDISASGIFLYADLPLAEDEEVELLFTLPYEFSPVQVRVACNAKVVRVESNGADETTGIAAAIQSLDFLTKHQFPIEAVDLP